jgi:hypothetical protein
MVPAEVPYNFGADRFRAVHNYAIWISMGWGLFLSRNTNVYQYLFTQQDYPDLDPRRRLNPAVLLPQNIFGRAHAYLTVLMTDASLQEGGIDPSTFVTAALYDALMVSCNPATNADALGMFARTAGQAAIQQVIHVDFYFILAMLKSVFCS